MKKKLKIAMFFSSDPARPDGLLNHIYYLSNGLSKLGHKVVLFGPNKKTKLAFRNYVKIEDLIEIDIAEETTIYITIKSKSIQNPTEVIEQKEKFDIIHFHDPYIPFVSLEVLKKIKLPVVTTFHTAWDKDSRFNFLNNIIPLFKEKFKKVKGAIFVSKIGRTRWQNLFSSKTIKKVILNGIDHRVYYPTNKKKNAKIVILFVARIVPRKGLLYLLKAFKNLLKKTKNIKLTVLGDGPQLSTCMKYARIHNFKKYINFKGYIIGKEKIRSYQEADIFCAPYRNEAFGLTLLEAMAIGVPIVSFKNSAFKEILKNYPYQELLVKPKDTNKLAEALSKLINNEKMRKELSSWEIKESKKYSWKKVAKETEEFYYQILNK